MNSLGWYIEKSVEPLLEEVKESQVIDINGCIAKNEFKRTELDKIEERWWEKKMYGQYCREVSECADMVIRHG